MISVHCDIVYKFCNTRFSDSGVSGVRSCTDGVDNFTTLNSATFARGAGLLGTEVIINWVFHKYLLEGGTTTPIGLYARLCHVFLVFWIVTLH